MYEEDIIIYDSKGRVIEELYQWDKDISIVIKGLESVSPVPTIHICSRTGDIAYVIKTSTTSGGITGKIPNILLQQRDSLVVYIYVSDASGHRTTHMVNIPLIPRAKPSDYEFSETVDYVDAIKLSDDLKKLREDFDAYVASGDKITIDAEMSDTSTNPVQNKVVKKYIDSNGIKPATATELGGVKAEPATEDYTEEVKIKGEKLYISKLRAIHPDLIGAIEYKGEQL